MIAVEQFATKEILHFLDLLLPEIVRDYNEASYLYPFWKNYPPCDRGRSPTGEQYPWIEVGEKVFAAKLAHYFAANFKTKDSGLPSGSDNRCVISSEKIRQILKITDAVWLFIDVKSAGPRDNYNHSVMSPYQISGEGIWNEIDSGVKNPPISACGKRVSHDFPCSLPPIYVLSDKTVAPMISFAIKPVYSMLMQDGKNTGQPLVEIKLACIPNGILLTKNPNYLASHPSLFLPGKDDKKKNPNKIRARVSFDILKEIADWRVSSIQIPYD